MGEMWRQVREDFAKEIRHLQDEMRKMKAIHDNEDSQVHQEEEDQVPMLRKAAKGN